MPGHGGGGGAMGRGPGGPGPGGRMGGPGMGGRGFRGAPPPPPPRRRGFGYRGYYRRGCMGCMMSVLMGCGSLIALVVLVLALIF